MSAEQRVDSAPKSARFYRTPEQCIDVVCDLLTISRADLIAGRSQRCKGARFLAMHAARVHTTASYPEIGAAFDVHHTTALNAHRRVDGMVVNDPSMAEVVADIAARLGAS